jgi:hypothetical protein
MQFSHQPSQVSVHKNFMPISDPLGVDFVSHNESIQLFATDAIRQISRMRKSLSFRAKRRELKEKLYGNPFNVR